MIIFDLDGTLANIDHRRHFVDPSKRDDCYYHSPATLTQSEGWYYKDRFLMCEPPKAMKFTPDWQAFYEACVQDQPNLPVFKIFNKIHQYQDVKIWSGRCESVRDKTIHWFMKKCPIRPTYWNEESWNHVLKMRPVGDSTPDDQLKEKWLDETYEETKWGSKSPIEFVFDDRPKVVRMWRRRGIFVFNCCQHDGEF